ncbi:MAG: threo-3-hydroxy-L-aspartate ammonia-lyase [Vicinamibacteria bacterium]|nr:threo-3-hydroxy-L-aspartate ammonia-lyase [Vicinamibacteria bacterium]
MLDEIEAKKASIDVNSVTYADVTSAEERLLGVAIRTPVITSRTVDERVGGRIFFKCENLQRGGAFKFRGAYNALARLTADQRKRGVITYSSGNHAQAIALASRLLGIPATIVMPKDAPAVKAEATRGYGGEVITYDKHQTTREELAARLAKEKGLTVIPPYDHPDVIAGQGTAAKELIDDVPDLDLLLVPCGGGGFLSGCAITVDALLPGGRIIGVEPAMADDATRSFRTGVLHKVSNPETIADGARTPFLGDWTFPLVRRHVDDMVTVDEEAIVRSMFFVWERLKLVVEPTGALTAAAVLEDLVPVKGLRVGVMLSGGNVDLAALAPLMQSR